MAITDGNAAQFTSDSAPLIGSSPTGAQANRSLAQHVTTAIKSTVGKPMDWARGVLSGSLHSIATGMPDLDNLMKGFGADQGVNQPTPMAGTAGVEGRVPAGAGAAYGAGAGSRAAAAQDVSILKANILKSREHALLAKEDAERKQGVVNQEQELVKNGNMDEIQAGIPEKDLPKGWQQNNLNPEKVHYFATGLDEKGNFLYGAYKVHSLALSPDNLQLLQKYGTGDWSKATAGQTFYGSDANRLLTEINQARVNKVTDKKIAAFQSTLKLNAEKLKKEQMTDPDNQNVIQSKNIYGKYVGQNLEDPESELKGFVKMQQAAANGDKDAQFALPYISAWMTPDKVAQLQTQLEEKREANEARIEEARERLASRNFTAEDWIKVRGQDQSTIKTLNDAISKLVAAQKNPASLTQGFMQQYGIGGPKDLPGVLAQKEQDLEIAKKRLDEDTQLVQRSLGGPASDMVTVQIPGHPPGRIPAARLQDFFKAHPNAVHIQGQ